MTDTYDSLRIVKIQILVNSTNGTSLFKKKGRIILLKILRYMLSIITLLFALYGKITKDFKFVDIMILFLGLTMLVLGIEEFQKERKVTGWFLIAVFLFSLYVSIEGFLLS